MTYRLPATFAVLGLLVLCSNRCSNAQEPDAETSRKTIEKLIQTSRDEKKPATLGLMREAIQRSIAYGGAAYDAGNHKECYDFYRTTAEQLIAGFEAKSLGKLAAEAMPMFANAIALAKKHDNDERKAWAMRYGFDRVLLCYDLRSGEVQLLNRMGLQYFARNQYEEAENAFLRAEAVSAELRTADPVYSPNHVRETVLLLAQSQLALGKYEDAAKSIEQSAAQLPKLPDMKYDIRTFYGTNTEKFDSQLESLGKAATAKPKNASLQFLLGYMHYFSGNTTEGSKLFSKVQEIDPNHTGAKLFASKFEL